ncbi:ABC transporter ATP-binding protein [Sporosarcina limicola]|uniref:ABC-type dipeptide/oligopeptide/nickel transport system ATPase subunit n=1 Tax=Sporosarcina limicola TaxID=34101 RepID=A0A927MEI0_9BACL|nr:dipeptide/oligopeptide/nickel ABC transporter ATP-binding protein [Sporosarcina limicola]MBE1553264.1 ABC-type dipeptide/oligopeptide/nickel transport system ATPase subunit [Sporosarcina limicola]
MLLTVENVSKSYRKGNKVLRDIDLSVGEGEIVGLIGESGSGKSTLSRLIMQLEAPETGVISFNGTPVTKRLRKTFYEDCQLVFQNASAALNPSWTVREILMEPLRNSEGDRAAHIRDMLGSVKLTDAHLNRRPSELSGGERQRVNLLRSILVNPKLLVCDEIVSSLDRLIQREIIDLLIELNRETGMAMLFISHDLQVVEYICDRIYIMKDGKIVEESVKVDGEFEFSHTYSKKLFGSMFSRGLV